MVSVLRTATISILLGFIAGKALGLHISRIYEVKNECFYENMEPRKFGDQIHCRVVERLK